MFVVEAKDLINLFLPHLAVLRAYSWFWTQGWLLGLGIEPDLKDERQVSLISLTPEESNFESASRVILMQRPTNHNSKYHQLVTKPLCIVFGSKTKIAK